jgi:hypothetical protein
MHTINILRVPFEWLNALQLFAKASYREIIFLVSFIAHIPYLFGRYLPREKLTYFSGDENALIRVIERYQSHMAAGNWGALFSEKLEYGYGFLYHLSYSVFTYPFALLAGDEGILAAGRLLSAAFESATIVLVCMIARRVGAPIWLTILLGVAMAFTPGLMVIHKPLSAEQLSNLLIVGAAYSALTMPLSSLRKNLFLVSMLAAAAISIKLNAVLQGLFFALIILFRLYEARIDFLLSKQPIAERAKTLAIDCSVIASGLATFFVWNLPIVHSSASRDNFFDWLIIQAESNQNSQRGSFDYRGIHQWWPKIDQYFGDNSLLPWILLSGLVACIVSLLLKKSRDVSAYSLLALIWVGVPASYVILSVKKVWLWYLVLPGFFLFLGPVFLYVAGNRLCEKGAAILGRCLAATGVLLLIAQVYVAIPDYAAFAGERWSETNRPDFIEAEIMRASLTQEVDGKLRSISMIADPLLTLPVEEWRREGAAISIMRLPAISEKLIANQRPDYIIIRYWGYAHHQGNRQKALADFRAKLKTSCETVNACYEEAARYELSKTIVYRKVR